MHRRKFRFPWEKCTYLLSKPRAYSGEGCKGVTAPFPVFEKRWGVGGEFEKNKLREKSEKREKIGQDVTYFKTFGHYKAREEAK